METITLKDGNFRTIRTAERIFSGWAVASGISDVFPKKIKIELRETLQSDLCVFTVLKNACGFELTDTEVEVAYLGGHTAHKITVLNTSAQSVTVRNCKFKVSAETQVNVTAISNCGSMNTMLESGADGLSIEHCRFDIRVTPEEFPYENKVQVVENILANSAAVYGNYIFAQVKGNGSGQKAVGIYNSGRYFRCENNNIKANGCHNKGELKEAAHACGFYNEGQYLVFAGNNCVGEWGGKCIGLENRSQYCTITGNKILATHTVCGRTVVLSGERNTLANNIITGTSRNPKGVEILAGLNTVTGNYLETLQPANVLQSGSGIWIEGEGTPISRCTVVHNTIVHARDFGIYLENTQASIVAGNVMRKHIETDDFVAILQINCKGNRIEVANEGDVFETDHDRYHRIWRNREKAICSLKAEEK